MIHTVENFYNKAANKIRETYFKGEHHGLSNNINYWSTLKNIEDFSNGVTTYRQFIGRLSKSTGETTVKIHEIISYFIISFGSYSYRPK